MRHILPMVLFTIALTTIPAAAQDNSIAYGDVVTGEITDREFEIPYVFSGEAGDIVIINMESAEALGDMDSPEIILLDTDSRVLSDTSSGFSFGSTTLVSQLPESGQYTILATREDGRAGDSVGEYNLLLTKPSEIVPDGLTVTMTSEQTSYFLAQEDASFMIGYEKNSGEFSPQITVYTLNETNDGLDKVVEASGDGLTLITLGLLEPGTPYIVQVTEAPFDFNFQEISVEFNIETVKKLG